jgi:hypothetical protein
MNLKRKFEIAELAIRSIAEHDDESENAVRACLSQLRSCIDKHELAISPRRKIKAEEKRVADVKKAVVK